MIKTIKRIRLIGISVFMIFILTISWYLIDRFSYSKKFQFYSVNCKAKDSLLTIGIIGDSWVAGKKLDSLLQIRLLENGFRNKILSIGFPGAKSKFIYQTLFKEMKKGYSSKFIIENCPDYCIVIAGVNDAIGQIGGANYSYHMIQIIRTLIHYKIKPIVISLPEFGIEETNAKLDFVSKERNSVSAYFNNNGGIDNIRTYRKKLDNELDSEKLKDSIILINFDNVCGEYRESLELYENSSHLSKNGNVKLTQLIANELVKKFNTY